MSLWDFDLIRDYAEQSGFAVCRYVPAGTTALVAFKSVLPHDNPSCYLIRLSGAPQRTKRECRRVSMRMEKTFRLIAGDRISIIGFSSPSFPSVAVLVTA